MPVIPGPLLPGGTDPVRLSDLTGSGVSRSGDGVPQSRCVGACPGDEFRRVLGQPGEVTDAVLEDHAVRKRGRTWSRRIRGCRTVHRAQRLCRLVGNEHDPFRLRSWVRAAEVGEHERMRTTVVPPRGRVQDGDAILLAPTQPDGLGRIVIRMATEWHLHAPSQDVLAAQPQSEALDDRPGRNVEGLVVASSTVVALHGPWQSMVCADLTQLIAIAYACTYAVVTRASARSTRRGTAPA